MSKTIYWVFMSKGVVVTKKTFLNEIPACRPTTVAAMTGQSAGWLAGWLAGRG